MSFQSLLKRYRLADLIKVASALSQKLWNDKSSIAELSRMDSSRFVRGAFKKAGSTYLTPWHLMDIVYYGIVLSAGDFGVAIPSQHDFLSLYNEYLEYENNVSGVIYKDLAEEDALFYMLFGLGQKTFWFQEREKLFHANFRFYRMLYFLPKANAELPSYFRHLEHKYGCTFSDYNLASMVIVWLAGSSTVINFPLKFEESPRFARVNNSLVNNLLQHYISDYDPVRRSTLKARALYLTPVLRSTQHELLVSNAFLLARKGFTNLYWESRELCLAEDGTELNLILGRAFEKYVDELLERYLPKGKYKRLEVRKGQKQADIAIFGKNYLILIEQKFAMLNISQQDVEFDLERVDSWLSAFVQAARQLQATSANFQGHPAPIIKLILFFDNLNIADGLVKDRVVKISQDTADGPVDVENLFMISIGELERMVQILGKDEAAIDAVIAEKLARQQSKDYSKGVEFDQIMDQMSVEGNEFIKTLNPLEGEADTTGLLSESGTA